MTAAADAGRAQRIALAERALWCADAITCRQGGGLRVGIHDQAENLRLLALRSDAAGLPSLGEAARLMEAVLSAPHPTEALLRQAVDVLTLAGRDACRAPRDIAPDLGPIVDALRAHVRYTCEGR